MIEWIWHAGRHGRVIAAFVFLWTLSACHSAPASSDEKLGLTMSSYFLGGFSA